MNNKIFESAPMVRIKKVIMDNITVVEHGTVTLSGWDNVWNNKGSMCDILGIYGPMGSGKTSVLNVINIIKNVMDFQVSGTDIYKIRAKEEYTSNIKESRIATVAVSFDMLYPNKTRVFVDYTFHMKGNGVFKDDGCRWVDVKIFDEQIYIYGTVQGETLKKQLIIKTNSEILPFEPKQKLKEFLGVKNLGKKTEVVINELNKRKHNTDLQATCTSFIFGRANLNCQLHTAPALLDIVAPYAQEFFYHKILMDVRSFVENIEYIPAGDLETDDVEKKAEKVNMALPGLNYTADNLVGKENWYRCEKAILKSEKKVSELNAHFEKFNAVLSVIIPGVSVKYLHAINAADGYELMITQNGLTFPFKQASMGTKRFIRLIGGLVRVMNNPSVTLMVDEFDSRLYEVTMGEIIDIFKTYGKGQLIFTAHNLYLMERLQPEFVCLTTLNPKNRFMKFINMYTKVNLRELYRNASNPDNDEWYKEKGRLAEKFYEPLNRRKFTRACFMVGDYFEKK